MRRSIQLISRPKLKPILRFYASKKPEDDFKSEVEELTKKMDENLQKKPEESELELDKNFMNFRRLQEQASHERSYIFGWKSVVATLVTLSAGVGVLLYMRKKRLDEEARNRKMMAGKARIGGEWQLVDTDGKVGGSADHIGKWVLMYFGFTNCPDICPDEIEKMVDIVDNLDRDAKPIPVVPVFITVDPERDTPERVKKYCAEFSPKIKGYTGTKEQVEKVLKTFRIYHSQGPATTDEDDYIVDHTVMMYLIAPDGNFYDYYGQNRRAGEIATMATPKQEYKVQVPLNPEKKKYSILQFNGPLKVEPGAWTRQSIQLAREDNRANVSDQSASEFICRLRLWDLPKSNKTTAKDRSTVVRPVKNSDERSTDVNLDLIIMIVNPGNFLIRDETAEKKDRWFRSVCEGGAGEHSDYWVFLKSGTNFQAHKVDDWYRFMPNPRHRTLDIDQAEEQFQQRNKVLNQFALKAKIQQTLRDQDEDGGKVAKPVALKIKDEGSSDDDAAAADEDDKIADASADVRGNAKKKKDESTREKGQETACKELGRTYESEDGEDEGREYDYISDSGSDTSREEITVDEKIDRDMVGVGEEAGMNDESEDDEEEEEDGKKKLLKRLKQSEQANENDEDEKKLRLLDQVEQEKESSGSESDDPDNPRSKTSVLFMQLKDRKRALELDNEAGGSEPKKSRDSTPAVNEPSTISSPQQDGLDEATVRRLLTKRPHTTKRTFEQTSTVGHRPFEESNCCEIGRNSSPNSTASIQTSSR
ncbi:Transcription initiation factor IIF subunit alpha [Aphelenchoides besseyi]|nr:Transcription initiation factor IIF subunit alpha [Aphelenchoides besseyi]